MKAHEIELTPEQKMIHDLYTSYEEQYGSHIVKLRVDHQSFRLSYDPETREEAQWMRKMLAIALSTLVRQAC